MDNEELKVKCLEMAIILDGPTPPDPKFSIYELDDRASEIYLSIKTPWVIEERINAEEMVEKDTKELGFDPIFLVKIDGADSALYQYKQYKWYISESIEKVLAKANIVYFGDLVSRSYAGTKINGLGKVYRKEIIKLFRELKIFSRMDSETWENIRKNIHELRELHKDKILSRLNRYYCDN